jgi:hypothetical protein
MRISLWAMISLLPSLFAGAGAAETACKSIWIPDIKSVAGKWEGTAQINGAGTLAVSMTINSDGTFVGTSTGTVKLVDGQLRFASRTTGKTGTETLQECNGEKRLFTMTDDGAISSELRPAQ